MTVDRNAIWDDDEERRRRIFGPRRTVQDAVRRDVSHVRKFVRILEDAELEDREEAARRLFFFQQDDQFVTEVLGFRMIGHPWAVLGAFRLPRHKKAKAQHGRATLAEFLTNPPRPVAVSGPTHPPGLLLADLPRTSESFDEFRNRVVTNSGRNPFLVDPKLIEFAFDFRLNNPSEVRHLTAKEEPRPSILRTTVGHILSGVSVGLRRTLHRNVDFITLTDVQQHRPDRDQRLPTLAFNRNYISLEAKADPETGAVHTLALHPSSAAPDHLFGGIYDGLEVPAERPPDR